MARAPRRPPASAEAAHVIEMMLASGDPEQVKGGLQKACEVLESGQAFLRHDFLTTGLTVHLTSPSLRVRRWAYKLAALLKDPQFLDQLETALLGFETDPENRGWASAAFSALADDQRKAAVTARLGDYRGTSLELAAKLYARGEPSRDDLNIAVWERDPLARKWLCLLCGYARDNPRTIDQRFGDLDLVRNSVHDDDREVVEYSIWAEHRHPDGSYRHLRRKPDELLAFANVRRWVYRLLTKDTEAATSNLDLLTEKMNAANETSEVAREGLALGLASLQFDDRRLETIDWFSNEASPRVKLALVDHLALRANRQHDAIARDVLIAAYSCRGPFDLIGAKILSVAKPEWGLTQVLPATKLLEAKGDLFGDRPQVFIQATKLELDMSTTKISQSGTGNSMTGVAGGDIVQSTINALHQQADSQIKDLAPLIETFVRALDKSTVDNDDKAAALAAAHEAAKATGEEKRGKLATLKSVVRGMLKLPGMAAEAVEGGEKLVHAIQHALT